MIVKLTDSNGKNKANTSLNTLDGAKSTLALRQFRFFTYETGLNYRAIFCRMYDVNIFVVSYLICSVN